MVKLIEMIMTKSYLTEAHLKGEERKKFIQDFQNVLDDAKDQKDYVDKEVSDNSFILKGDVFG